MYPAAQMVAFKESFEGSAAILIPWVSERHLSVQSEIAIHRNVLKGKSEYLFLARICRHMTSRKGSSNCGSCPFEDPIPVLRARLPGRQ